MCLTYCGRPHSRPTPTCGVHNNRYSLEEKKMLEFRCRSMSASGMSLPRVRLNWSTQRCCHSRSPKLRAYSKESVVAEKFEAMVKLGIANSRMKDFYDLCVMARQFEFEGPVLSAAINATFERRTTALPSSRPLAFTAEFGEAATKQTQWKAFLRRSGLNASQSLSDVVNAVNDFVMPVVEGILSKKDFRHTWMPGGPWTPD